MIAFRLQCFFVAFLVASVVAVRSEELRPGSIHRLVFQDVDGNALSTSDGHVTIINVTTRQKEKEARRVAELVPDRCIGDPKFRYVTLVNFQRKIARPFHGLTRKIIRGRLDQEAEKLMDDYAAKRLTRDPRRDIFVVADFESKASTQLGLSPNSDDLAIFVFDGEGKLVNRWTGLPPGDSLSTAIAAAE